jgi:hypothetical protein
MFMLLMRFDFITRSLVRSMSPARGRDLGRGSNAFHGKLIGNVCVYVAGFGNACLLYVLVAYSMMDML